MRTRIFKLLFILLLFSAIINGANKGFNVKGFHIDLRCQVMTIPALKNFANELSAIGVNTIIMEWEASFPYQKHATLSNKYAYSPEEIKTFVSHCKSLNIEVVPLQNCFGHVEYILRHDRYQHLAEDRKEVSQICPMKEEENVAIFKELFEEMAALHTSEYIHIGGDETYLLGHCKLCSAKAEKEGKSKLFVDYVKQMCKLVTDLGKRPILWADIILKYPEAVAELPTNAIFVDWNYGWGRDYFGNMDNLFKAGVTFWGAPSIRSHPDNIYLTQWEKHFNNQRDFIPYSRKANYEGMIMTSWSTSGTYGFVYDTNWEVQEMHPVRYVYPLSGFRILVAAYGESLNSTKPLAPEAFVLKYAQERFGFSKAESSTIWKMFTTPQEHINRGKDDKGKTSLQLRDEAMALQNEVSKLYPKQNQKEFDHLQLMLDIRVEFLKFKELESRYESNTFERNMATAFVAELESMVEDAIKQDARFFKLNTGYLHDGEIKGINEVRSHKLLVMYDTMKRLAEMK